MKWADISLLFMLLALAATLLFMAILIWRIPWIAIAVAPLALLAIALALFIVNDRLGI